MVLVYVIAESKDKINQAIIETEKELKISNFHWAKHNWKIKRKFFSSVAKNDYYIRAAVIKNPFSKDKFEEAIKSMLIERKIEQIIIDGVKPKWYSLRLKKILRDYGISTRKIKTGNDKSYPCLRLADAYAGLIKSYWNDQNNQKVKDLYLIASGKIKTTQIMDGQAGG